MGEGALRALPGRRVPDEPLALVLDILERVDAQMVQLLEASQLAQLEPWLSKRQLADHLGPSTRWLDGRVAEGMPHRVVAGAHKFRLSEVEPWLHKHGYLSEEGER